MITDDQVSVIAFLTAPSTHGVRTVDRIETHGSIIFLAGERVYKLKRAVRFDYMDFSTSDKRRALCELEVRLNRRTAPTLYRGVVAVTRQDDGRYALDGPGTPVDWLVEMNRFPQDALFDRMAAAGRLDIELMTPLAQAIAAFHLTAERRTDRGGKAGMNWVVDGNAAGFAEFGQPGLDASACSRLIDDTRLELERRSALLDERRLGGLVRQCHGDLHLRNIVLLDRQPTLFDGVEFNDRISCTDVLYDLAFLLMDLWRRRLPQHANVVLNRYLAETADFSGVSLLPLFLSCRAAVRAKTGATAAQLTTDGQRRTELLDGAREYLVLSAQLLHPSPPVLVAVGGLSGSGKSTLAVALAPGLGSAPGAVVLRSDEIRKRLCGTPPLEPLGPEGYTAEVTARVYAMLTDQAAAIIHAGHSVIADAVHARPADRQVIEHVAAAASVQFLGVWLDAPEAVLMTRAAQRQRDPSDADTEVIRRQQAQGTGDVTWRRIDASLPAPSVLARTTDYIRERLHGELRDSR